MLDSIANGNYMPHGHCLVWQEDLLWTNVGGDAMTTLAYLLIPIALIYLIRKRDDLAFNWVFVMFAAFIFLCGLTHAIGILNVWHGYYYLSGVAKVSTGVISLLTAWMLWRLMPRALAQPSHADLEQKNESLLQAQKALEETNSELEKRVAERTLALQKLATTDALTGLLNRGEIERRLSTELERGRRYKRCTSVMMMDIDHFKAVNDTYGHAGGDQILRVIGDTLREQLRENDLAGRWGGEEFLLLLPETSLDDAEKLAERIRQAVETMETVDDTGNRLSVTVSIGVARSSADDSVEDVSGRADKALYQAKENGRNRVESRARAVAGDDTAS